MAKLKRQHFKLTTKDPEGDHLRRMEAICKRDSARLLSVELESRTPSDTLHGSGLAEVETFIFSVRVKSLGESAIRFELRVTAELALASAEENPRDADALVAAWAELSTIADQLNEAACQGGVQAEQGRLASSR